MKRSAGTSSDDASGSKRPRVTTSGKPHLMKRYPINLMCHERMSPEAIKDAQKALKEEERELLQNQRVLPLMKTTFSIRRQYVVSEAESARNIMERHPFMKVETVVCVTFKCALYRKWYTSSMNVE